MDARDYVYAPLKHRQIRLLRVFRDDDVKLRCRFEHASLDDLTIDYIAVSYTWGDATTSSKIWFDDGHYLNLTGSGADVLTFFVDANVDKFIWIDLLCINQQDLDEKSHQVRLMGKIFASAMQVVVWLGKQSEDSDLALDFVHILYKRLRDLKSTETPITRDSFCESPQLKHPSSGWTALRRLLQRPWFDRVWVVQEVVMAADNILIVCGDLSVRWSTFASALTLVQANTLGGLLAPVEYELGSDMRPPDGLYSIVTIQALRWLKQGIDLQTGITHCVRFDSTDPRDKFYGVMGMVNDIDDPILDPNYRASTHDVFVSSCRYMLTKTSDLRVLHFAGLASPRLVADLSSWVSDWSARHRNTVLGDLAKDVGYQASGSTQSSVRADIGSELITFRGILLDTIRKSIKPPSVEMSWGSSDVEVKEHRKAELSWLNELRCLVCSSHRYKHHDRDVVWRTLIANSARGVSPAGDEYREAFEAWLTMDQYIATHGNSSRPDKMVADQARAFTTNMNHMRGRVALWTQNGLLGLGPPTVQSGDLICIIMGARTPFLLRATVAHRGSKPTYHLVGECYVHGLMDGEGLDGGEEQDLTLT